MAGSKIAARETDGLMALPGAVSGKDAKTKAPYPEKIAFGDRHLSLASFPKDYFAGPLVFCDVETTGLSPHHDRIIELAAVRYGADGVVEGRPFHQYFDPQRPIPVEASDVHGITDEVMRQKVLAGEASPMRRKDLENFSKFIDGAKVVAHNGRYFDWPCILAEMKRLRTQLFLDSVPLIDSAEVARVRYPGRKVSLDDLCARLKVDRSARSDFHGALIDVGLLASVFPRLLAGEARSLLDYGQPEAGGNIVLVNVDGTAALWQVGRSGWTPSETERAARAAFLAKFRKPVAQAPVVEEATDEAAEDGAG